MYDQLRELSFRLGQATEVSIALIQEVIEECYKVFEAKGYERSYWTQAFILYGHDMNIRIKLEYKWDKDKEDSIEETTQLDVLAPALMRVISATIALRTCKERRELEWRQRLVDLTTEGESMGFAVEYIEMLRKTAEKLAENAIEAPRD